MALFLTFQTVFLLALIHLSTCRSEGLSEYLQYPPESVNVSIHSNKQCLHIEWTVPLPAYILNLKMIFQIDIRRSANSNPVENKNYTTTLKPNETLQWCWHSALPLQCISHSVRIRSMVDDERFPESRIWSPWSKWEESRGQDSSGQLLIFPYDTIYAEEDANVTFCCISKMDNDNMTFYFGDKRMQEIKLSPRVTMFEVNNIPISRPTGFNAICLLNSSYEFVGTVLYVGGVLEEPKNFFCETRDLRTLNCTWDPGRDTLLPQHLPTNYSLFEWYSKKKVVCDHRNWCIWQLAPEVQDMYNFTLMAENKLRKRRTSIFFNVTQQVHPKHAREISVENVNATEATLTWQMIPDQKKLSFLCQIEVYHDGKVVQYNTSNSEFTLRELQPYTGYSTRVRCCTANHFWKWSEWSSKNFTTKEAAPTGSLDIWRTVQPVSGGYNVKLFWKPLPTFQANGKILNYSIVMEALGDVPKVDISFSESPGTEKTIDQQPYEISIKAINSAGSSTPSVIVVSGDTENRNIEEDRVNGTGDGIYLSWKPDPREIEGYVVDWCNHPQDAICDFQWKKFSPNTTSAIIKSANLLMTIIILLAFFSLLLIIGFNMKIHWVKEKCFPDIPDPYKSSVLSLMKFKGNIHQAILNTNDCIPDAIEVINRSEISKTQGSSTLLVGNETTKPAYLYLLPTGKDPLDPQSCICFENFTYCQAASDLGSCSPIQMIPTDPIRSVEPPEHLPKVEKDYMGSLGNIPAEDADLNYVAQLAPTMSGDKGCSSLNLPEATHCSEYKMQMVISTDSALSLPLEGDRPISVASLD
ncbi:oncostatin-M-specific receptor subunit beta [Gracilinanus agilis]|uniref:oncostatin-M-specific receptor subunit beta n=1 Tax=Gracilinanus agilis TaxID=191870 RepID=UPI001CFE947A|nr:oncostatin-M-specific receptor subunit beta [Gracilinanus agilis]